ncbi:hypothetical protein EON63_02745 [archaeon]|nr:MAG: hypothetical protein EON63_02745 [archaeon]
MGLLILVFPHWFVGNEYDIAVTSSCAEILLDHLDKSAILHNKEHNLQKRHGTYTSLTRAVCTLLSQCPHPHIQPYTTLLSIYNNYSEVVEELVRGVMVCVDNRICDGTRLVLGGGCGDDDTTLEVSWE